MKITTTFWKLTLLWALGLTAVFTFLSFLSGGGDSALAHLPGWLGLGLALGAYPAGVRLVSLVLPDGHRDHRAIALMAANAVGASIVFLVLAGYVGPAVQPSGPARGDDVTAAARSMTLGELRAEARAAREAADPAGSLEPTTIRAWFPFNVLVWNLFVRLSGSALPFLFAWIGVMIGFWSRLTPRPDARIVQVLAVGFLLLFATYLANENSFEWIVVQAAGPVPFAGMFALIVPSLLFVGLGWPTVLMQWRLPAP